MTTDTKPRVAPNSKESEMMVLGCMLTNIDALNMAAGELDDIDFYYTQHKIIFTALKKAYRNGKPADIHLICEDLKSADKLHDAGGAGYITTLAQYAGTSANTEEYVEIVKNKTKLRKIIAVSKKAEKAALKNPDDANHIIENLELDIKVIESQYGKKIPIIETAERLKKEEEFLRAHRGKKYLGLTVETIDEFNENFLGLRGLMLLAAAPNVGKTAFTIQIAEEVLSAQKDVCLVYVSLEMSEEQIFRRMQLNLSGINFRTFVFGSQKQTTFDEDGGTTFFTTEEFQNIKKAKEILLNFGHRLQIIDQSTCPYIDARTVINYVEALKQKTKTSKAIVIIDYLQVWPTNPSIRFSNEIEIDKWRIGEMKKIRDSMNENEEPVIVITEARKPSNSGKDEVWGGNLSDVMGSARGTYTPDVVILLSQIQPETIKKLWESKKMPEVPESEDHEDVGSAIISFLASHGMSICKLKIPKCRDGMQRFNILLIFHFWKNKFTYVDWEKIYGLIENTKRQGKK